MKILIADDDLTTRIMLRGVVSKWGFEVCEAGTGLQAWEILSQPDSPALALVDWMMPGMNGPDLCRKVKARPTDGLHYVILLTARSERQDVVHGLDSGADDFVAKPYNQDELRARLDVGRRMVLLRQEILRANDHLERRVLDRTYEVQRLLHQKEELLLHLGHDLKTPLTPVLALLPLLLEAEKDADRRRMLELAHGGALEIEALVARVLELCRVETASQSLAPTRRELRGLVEDTLRGVRSGGAGDARAPENQVPAGLFVTVDPVLMPQALGAILDNAVGFTQPSGRIEFRASRIHDQVTLQVRDDGLGIPGPELERVFDAFYKVDPSRHNRIATGLGLTLARTIIERHGGTIRAHSEGLGRGTTIAITLPGEHSNPDPHMLCIQS